MAELFIQGLDQAKKLLHVASMQKQFIYLINQWLLTTMQKVTGPPAFVWKDGSPS